MTMKEMKELLLEINEKTLESVSRPRRDLVKFLREVYSKEVGEK